MRAKEGKAAGAVEDNSGTTAEVDDGAAGADDLSPSDDGEDGDDDDEAEGDAAAVNGVNGADATAKPGRRKRAKAKVRRRKLSDADGSALARQSQRQGEDARTSCLIALRATANRYTLDRICPHGPYNATQSPSTRVRKRCDRLPWPCAGPDATSIASPLLCRGTSCT